MVASDVENTPLPRAFYVQDTATVARLLLGQLLVRVFPDGHILSGIIVETEAYVTGDPASHAFNGPTPRCAAMFGPPGYAYVYVSYGLHTMLNVVTGPADVGEAVLLRALEPVNGTEVMRAHRGGLQNVLSLTNGPGKLAQAFSLSRAVDNGRDMTDPRSGLWIAAQDAGSLSIVTTTRIGITRGADLPLRFYVGGSPYISKP